MDEPQVRRLVREAIARHLGAPDVSATPAARPPAAPQPAVEAPQPLTVAGGSIVTCEFVIVRPPGEVDCIIEPSVTCNHCGYCLTYGH